MAEGKLSDGRSLWPQTDWENYAAQAILPGKETCFFTAIKTTPERNLELFGQCALKALAPDLSKSSFRTFEDLFDFLGNQGGNERIAVVIDELPYLAKKDGSITYTMQKYIDERWQFGKMFLIVCGSSVSFIIE